jgi:HSP20 family molecular chaperone IbpA
MNTMNGYPRDMFEEMDEIFDQLFNRMQEDFMIGNLQGSGFRCVNGRPGSYRSREEVSPPSRIATSPVTEVHRLDDEVKVIAELPGAAADSIHLEVRNSRLTIDADGIDTPYHTTAELPPVEDGSLQSTFRNGVLEVTFRTLQ